MAGLFKILDPNKDLRVEYPELRNYPEFAELSPDEMMFVWLYKNPSSDFYKKHYDDGELQETITKCFETAYGDSQPATVKASFVAQAFPENVKIALQFIERFRPAARMLAKMLAEKTLLCCEKDIDNENISSTEKIRIISSLPGLIETVEHGFGISKTKEEKEDESSLIDDAHESTS